MPLISETRTQLKQDLSRRESDNNQYAVNDYGYLGLWQQGAGALEDSGYVRENTWAGNGYTNKGLLDNRNWTGKDNVYSQSDFLDNVVAQENAMDANLDINFSRGVNSRVLHDSSSQADIASYSATAHLLGSGGADELFRDGTNNYDGYGTSGAEYALLGRNSANPSSSIGVPPPNSAGSAGIAGGELTRQLSPNNNNANNALANHVNADVELANDELANHVNADVELANDESSDAISNATETNIESVFSSSPWKPRKNPFIDFATMTYSISLYVVTPKQYTDLMNSSTKSVKDFILFIQSGGIDNTDVKFGAKRSRYFKNDYYIDDFQFKSLISGTSTMAAHNTFELNFTVTEPAGVTLFQNLHDMVHLELPGEVKNYGAQQYLAVVRFYGYDADGNQVRGYELSPSGSDLSDPTAISEKYIPFVFTGLSFRLSSDKVVYTCKAVCPETLISKDKVHGVLPTNGKLVGGTLAEVLVGNDGDGRMGLAEFLNNKSEEYANSNLYEYPDKYKIEFEPGQGWEDFEVLDAGSKTKHLPNTAMRLDDNVSANFLSGALTVQLDKKEFNFIAGTSIIKMIDIIVRLSTYVTDQINSLTDSNSQDVNHSDKNKKTVTWFKIRAEVTPLEWDKWRNDYAYEIKYVISRYAFVSDSVYFPNKPVNCLGIHKEYNFWFTGLNTEVLDFYQDYNALWYTAISEEYNEESPAKREEFNARSLQRHAIEIGTESSSFGGPFGSSKISSSIAADLYSPGDLAQATITIVGDPDFIAQSELFYSPSSNLNSDYADQPFLQDGSVNYDISEVYFAINYNTVVDYNLDSGLANTQIENLGYDLNTGNPGVSKYSLVYRANTITTTLASGKFTQELEGTLKPLNPDCPMDINVEPTLLDDRRVDPDQTFTPENIAVNSGGGDARRTSPILGGRNNDDSALTMPSATIVENGATSESLESGRGSDEVNVHDKDSIATDPPEPNNVTEAGNSAYDTSPPDNRNNDTRSAPPPEEDSYYISSAIQTASDVVQTTGRFISQVYADVSNNLSGDLDDASKSVYDEIKRKS